MRITATVLAIALLALPGCMDDGGTGPSTADFQESRKQKAAAGTARTAPKPPAKVSEPEQGTGETQFGAIAEGYRYDPKGKRDPFRSFEWEQMELDLADSAAAGPLEQFDVSQLSVVGVIWAMKDARALVQDPSGMTYIVAEGAKIGKNDGRVTHIADNLVMVKETYVDLRGEATTKDIEMRIRGTEGG